MNRSARKIAKKPVADVLAMTFTLDRLRLQCVGKRDRECLFRLAKEVAITDQNFEAAVHLRALERENKPTRRA